MALQSLPDLFYCVSIAHQLTLVFNIYFKTVFDTVTRITN